GVGVDGESKALRRRVILIYAGCARAQSRMTVLRREGTPSYRASQGDLVSVSQSCGACPPDRACPHPSTATPKLIRRSCCPVFWLSSLQVEGGPDEAGQFAGDGHGDFRPWFALGEQPVEAAVQALHRFVSQGHHPRGLSQTATFQAADARRVAVVP